MAGSELSGWRPNDLADPVCSFTAVCGIPAQPLDELDLPALAQEWLKWGNWWDPARGTGILPVTFGPDTGW